MRRIPDNHDQFMAYDFHLHKADKDHSNIFCCICNREIEFLEEYIEVERDENICLDRTCAINYLKELHTLKECLPF